MKVVTVARKRCRAPSTTANVVEYEAGALNIDGTRVAGPAWSRSTETLEDIRGGRYGTASKDRILVGPREMPGGGRWPANAILLHRQGCTQTGTQTVPGYTINRWSDGAKPFGGGAGHEYESEEQPDEQVAVWECDDSCAVVQLDDSKNKGHPDVSGTAARFFKQVQETEMNEIPQELVEYLITMISPPPECEPLVLVEFDLEAVEWESYEDSSVHGLIVVGNPELHMEDIDRVLRPGAHLLIVAPDDEPTGHTGACAVEDFGYEIRDAIAVLDTPGEFHYVAKASPSERNAGVVGHDTGTGRTVQNQHPTVKSVGIMEALLHDVPDGVTVVDPFMGSGTTGIACLRTGHSFIGIEQSAEYMKIADQRVRHWDRAENAWNGATIESEVEFEEEEAIGLDDLFGFGGEDDDEVQIGDCPVCEERDTEVEIKEKGERLEVCSQCAEDRSRVQKYLLGPARSRVQELEK